MTKAISLKTFALAATLGIFATQSSAEVTLAREGSWTTVLDFFQDGTAYCEAVTRRPGFSFGVWLQPYQPPSLQLFFADTDLGITTMDFALQIDRRAPWTLTDANTYENSIFFQLPEGEDSKRFIMELATGQQLHFLDARDQPLWSVSLAGSTTALRALADCREAIE